jgi:hypothetical protein
VAIAGEHLTGKQLAAGMSRALGQEVRYSNVPPEVYRTFGFPGADDLGNMFQFRPSSRRKRERRERREGREAREGRGGENCVLAMTLCASSLFPPFPPFPLPAQPVAGLHRQHIPRQAARE